MEVRQLALSALMLSGTSLPLAELQRLPGREKCAEICFAQGLVSIFFASSHEGQSMQKHQLAAAILLESS